MSAERPVALPASVRVIERGWLSSNNIVFDDRDAISVVDTGYRSHAPQTLALIEAAARGRPLARIVNTHLHSDHVGGNAALAQRFAAPIWIPAGEADAVDAWDAARLSYAGTAQQCDRFRAQRRLDAGETIELGGLAWRLLAAPGHDMHMLMLYCDEARTLISSDALWQQGFGAIFPELLDQPGFAAQRATLETITRLAPRIVIPGHGSPFGEVDAALAQAEQRLAALAASPQRNARQVLKVLVKFWLMQVRQATAAQLAEAFAAASYPRAIHQRYFADQAYTALLARVVDELAGAGALRLVDDRIVDVQASQ